MATAAENRRGIFAMLLSAVVVTSSDMFIREVARTFPVGEVLAVRGLIVSTIIGAAVLWFTRPGEIRLALNPFVLLRALCEATMVVLFVAALPHMIFADVTAVFLSSSLLSAALVAVIGFERVPLSNWLVLLIGFGGVAMVVRPTFDSINIGAVFAFLAAFMIAVRDLITRKVDPSIPSIIVTFATAVTVTIMGFCLMPFGDPWQSLSIHHAGLMLGAGIFVGAANFLGVYAYRKADISVVGPFRYAGLPYAIVAAFLVWGELPDIWSVVGGLIISATSIVAIWRQRIPNRGS